jgi:hypothetical protein
MPLGLDPGLLLAAKTGKGPLSPAFLSACQATMDVPLRRCALVAASSALLRVRGHGLYVPAVASVLCSMACFGRHDQGALQECRCGFCGGVPSWLWGRHLGYLVVESGFSAGSAADPKPQILCPECRPGARPG